MEVTINLDELIKYPDLTAGDIYELAKKSNGIDCTLPENFGWIEREGLIKITDTFEFVLLEKGEKIFGKKLDTILELAKEIRDLFPSGVRSGGYLVKSSEIDIADKLKKFFKKHKYTHEQVIEATKRYIEGKRNANWNYIQQAQYFIEKNGVSNLASECGNLNENSIDVKTNIML